MAVRPHWPPFPFVSMSHIDYPYRHWTSESLTAPKCSQSVWPRHRPPPSPGPWEDVRGQAIWATHRGPLLDVSPWMAKEVSDGLSRTQSVLSETCDYPVGTPAGRWHDVVPIRYCGSHRYGLVRIQYCRIRDLHRHHPCLSAL